MLGVDFFSAISRGSQFKVESVLFRIAKPENYLLPSPSREEVSSIFSQARQRMKAKKIWLCEFMACRSGSRMQPNVFR